MDKNHSAGVYILFIRRDTIVREQNVTQGYKLRAPEGMSILAFPWISPFQRVPYTPV
jgi:hypothetical protein